MGKAVSRDWFLEVGLVELSDHVRSITPNRSYAELDGTAMGATVSQNNPGLADFELAVTLFNDYDTGSVWLTLEAMFEDPDTPLTVTWRHSKTDAVSATNPEYSMSAFLFDLPSGGEVGEYEMMDVTFRNGSPTGVTKAIV